MEIIAMSAKEEINRSKDPVSRKKFDFHVFFQSCEKKHCDIDSVNCLTSYQYILKTFVTDIYDSSFTSYRYILQCGKLF